MTDPRSTLWGERRRFHFVLFYILSESLAQANSGDDKDGMSSILGIMPCGFRGRLWSEGPPMYILLGPWGCWGVGAGCRLRVADCVIAF